MTARTDHERAEFEKWLGIKPCGAAHDFGWEAWKARAALAATPADHVEQDLNMVAAAAPVVLPEPVYTMRVNGRMHSSYTPTMIAFDLKDGEHKLYTEQQVRALLATGGQAQAPMQCVECNSCGSAFDVDSYMAGYTDGKGHCLNCPGVDHSAPQQADARDADDADLIEWLSGQYLAADFQWGDPKTPVLVIEIAPTTSVCGDFRTDVRAAIAAAKEGAKNAS